MHINKLICAIAFAAAVVVAPRVLAETTPVEGAIEAWKVFVEQQEEGGVTLRVFPCENCDARSFELAEEFTLIVKGERIPNNQLGRDSGEPGTVIYNLKSGRAVHLIR